MSKLSKVLLDEIDTCLTHLECCTDFNPKFTSGSYAQPPKKTFFKKAHFLSSSLDDRAYIDFSILPKDLDTKLDIVYCFKQNEEQYKQSGGGVYNFTRVKQVDFKELRGVLPRFFPNIYRVDNMLTTESGEIKGGRYYLTIVNNEPKFLTQNREYEETKQVFRKSTKEDIEDFNFILRAACEFQFAEYFQWFIEIGFKKTQTLMITCPPHLLKKVLSNRDVPTGKERRAALKNWVREHEREVSPDYYIEVIEHLRGSLDCSIDNFVCKIHPSQSDLKKLEKLKLEKRGKQCVMK